MRKETNIAELHLLRSFRMNEKTDTNELVHMRRERGDEILDQGKETKHTVSAGIYLFAELSGMFEVKHWWITIIRASG